MPQTDSLIAETVTNAVSVLLPVAIVVVGLMIAWVLALPTLIRWLMDRMERKGL